MSDPLAAAIISGIVSIIASISVVWFSRRKAVAEGKTAEVDAATAALRANAVTTDDLLDERRMRVALETKVMSLEATIDALAKRVKRLEAQVISLGSEPVK